MTSLTLKTRTQQRVIVEQLFCTSLSHIFIREDDDVF